MFETGETYRNPKLTEQRLLTEPQNFLNHMDEQGEVPEPVFDAVVQNRTTGGYEVGIQKGVAATLHDVTEEEDVNGDPEYTIWWLEKTAEEVALNGLKHHFSRPAKERVILAEVPSARFEQRRLSADRAQAFVSPGMTKHDAPVALAKAENLYGYDSLRVSTGVKDKVTGRLVKRKLESLLVKDVPFEAWVTMFKDPGNILGKALPLRDEQSALSIMELFDQLELPVEALPEGPVSLVAAVLPYIKDEAAYRSVEQQLQDFRTNQEAYAREAARAGRDWALFDLELARSLKWGIATESIKSFLLQNADAWNEESLQIIMAHGREDDEYDMTTALAALLARAKQKLVGDELAVVTDSERVIGEVSAETRSLIKENCVALEAAYILGASQDEIYRLQEQKYSLLHQQQIKSGGGCGDDVANAFGDRGPQPNGVGEHDNPFSMVYGFDKFGSRTFSCPKGCGNFRWIPGRKEGTCWFCGTNVSCEEKKPAHAQQKAAPTWELVLGIKPKSIKKEVGKRALAGAHS